MTSRRCARLIAPLALLLACGSAAAQREAEVYTYSASGDVVTDFTTGFGAAQVQRTESDFSGGSRSTVLDGTAAATFQTLRSRAGLSIDSVVSGNYATAKTESSFSKTVTIGAGLSGLQLGTQLLLNVPLSFDGLARAGSATSGGASFSYTSADVSLRYRIVDLDQLVGVGGEGGPRPRELMSFSYGARLIYDSRFDAQARAGWRGNSSNTAPISGGDADIYLENVPSTGSIDLDVDTGPLSFAIETFVGHRLKITGSLDVFLQVEANQGLGYATGKYDNTFDAGVTSNIAGLDISDETPGVYPLSAVPEPGSMLLALAGLLTLALRMRAGQAKA
jgi:hypothetical protein